MSHQNAADTTPIWFKRKSIDSMYSNTKKNVFLCKAMRLSVGKQQKMQRNITPTRLHFLPHAHVRQCARCTRTCINTWKGMYIVRHILHIRIQTERILTYRKCSKVFRCRFAVYLLLLLLPLPLHTILFLYFCVALRSLGSNDVPQQQHNFLRVYVFFLSLFCSYEYSTLGVLLLLHKRV